MTPLLCLCMMVKNEATSLRRTLESCRGIVDHVVIFDTGSTDGTQQIAFDFLNDGGVPALDLHQGDFIDFATSRNEALSHTEGTAEFVLFLSGDESLEDANGLREWLQSAPSAGAFDVRIKFGSDLEYMHPRITRTGGGYRYEGVTHEALVHPQGQQPAGPAPCTVHYDPPAGQDKTSRWLLDLELLKAELLKRPDDPRTTFYLAQTLACLGCNYEARDLYLRRGELGGWEEERFMALHRAAVCEREVNGRNVVPMFKAAYAADTCRAEPLYAAAHYLFERDETELAYDFAATASTLPLPTARRLFIEPAVYTWRAKDLHASCAAKLGNHAEAAERFYALLESGALPASERTRVMNNLAAALHLANARPQSA